VNKKEILKDVIFYAACFLLGRALVSGWVFLFFVCFAYIVADITYNITKHYE